MLCQLISQSSRQSLLVRPQLSCATSWAHLLAVGDRFHSLQGRRVASNGVRLHLVALLASKHDAGCRFLRFLLPLRCAADDWRRVQPAGLCAAAACVVQISCWILGEQ
jgi:hypothetical protein